MNVIRDEVYYEHLEESAMGSPISPIFAEFFMQKLEFRIINTMTSIKFWYRYVDNVYSMVSTKDMHKILAKLNDFNQTISFGCVIRCPDIKSPGHQISWYYISYDYSKKPSIFL